MNTEEIERLLKRLKVNPSQFSMIQACPERKNVVYITFNQGVDINKFLTYQTESYVLKEGIRTTTIRPVGKREVLVTVYVLNPKLLFSTSVPMVRLIRRTQGCMVFILVSQAAPS